MASPLYARPFITSLPLPSSSSCRPCRLTAALAFHEAATLRKSSTSSWSCYYLDRTRTKTAGTRRRRYATLTGDSSSASSDSSSSSSDPLSDSSWPQPPPGHAHPTPYQILSTSQAEPYSKHRFYQLVKLYHPDSGACERHNHQHSVSSALRLERYRLVVAAHNLLSCPEKRNLYDRFGAGWHGVPVTVGSKHGSPAPRGPFDYRSGPNIWANATWEDWERYYQRRDNMRPQAPLYLSNANFVLCVILFALIGASMNLSRAESEGDKVVAARDLVHDRASKELRRVRQMSEKRPKDERIEFFVRQREAAMTGMGAESLRNEKAAKVLPEHETCLGQEMSAGGSAS